jgi:membrane associated rhomboid family serine protease
LFGFTEFRGVTRQLVLWNLGAYFLLLLLGAFARDFAGQIVSFAALDPYTVLHRGWIWQLVTYSAIHLGIISTLFELMSIWSLGTFLESNHGSRWLLEIFFVSIAGAGLTAVVMSLFLGPSPSSLYACWGGIFGFLIVYGVWYGDLEFMLFPLPIRIKAKYIVWVYMLIAVALLFSVMHMFALSELGGALFGWLYIRFAPRRGFAFAGSESLFGLRNQYYRWKRRRAAKKFEVYMRKHRDN